MDKLIIQVEKETAENIIETIERELKQSNDLYYKCEDGTSIKTDVGYVYEWFQEYKEKIRNKYC